MVKLDLSKLEKISDYAIALKDEIEGDIKKLSKYSSSSTENTLDDINKKIDLARTHGVNVDSLDEQVLEFRVILFKRDIANKIEEMHSVLNTYSFNIDKIEKEYSELQNEKTIDLAGLDEKMKRLKNEVIRANLKLMITDFGESDGTSVYSIDQIVDELESAKEKGIDVDDIEEMLS